jgi:preprotein translocase subunit YajC
MVSAASTLLGSLVAPFGLLLAQTGSAFSGILPIVLMFAVVYFLVLRPMSRQEKDRKKRIETIGKGDQVVIGGGIIGRISNLDDPKILVVEIADKVKVRVLRKDVVDTLESALKDGAKPAPAAAAKDDKPAKDEKAKPDAPAAEDARDAR